MTDIDTVAEAICRADKERNPTWGGNDAWEQQPEYKQDDYRAMAQAAIDAVQLTEETKTSRDWEVVADSPHEGHLRPSGGFYKRRRFVSQWVRVEGQQ